MSGDYLEFFIGGVPPFASFKMHTKVLEELIIDCSNLKCFDNNLNKKFGSLITENYDLGNAKKINAFFKCLFLRTPFSKDEIKKYNKILAERNLIVHNGGTYITKYIKQHKSEMKIKDNAFFHSINFDSDKFLERLNFLRKISEKIRNNSFEFMEKYMSKNEDEVI